MAKKEEIEKKEKAVNSNVQGVKVEKVLVENFVSLQHIMTNLAIKFENLSNQISKLLELFEISAKTLAERGGLEEGSKRVAEKLDSLLEQNKIIARGISLLHEKSTPEYAFRPQPVQRFQYPAQQPVQRFSSEQGKNPKFKR